MEVKQIGIVAIGRNEGERLKRCLKSLKKQCENIVYVDSGSTDGSVEYAKSIGVNVLELDMSIPFSAGRARNDGFNYLVRTTPEIKYVQFVDGDCELCEDWIEASVRFLDNNSSYAIACGRRMEIFPQKSIYNQLCDIEWNTATGIVDACGGDFLARSSAFLSIGGFNPAVIAGEEPELCYRLRHKGWKIRRLDARMTLHDAGMYKFSQWWYRLVRSGHAYAQGFALHGTASEKYCLKDCVRIWFWALLFPVMTILLAFGFNPIWVLLMVLYPIHFIRVATRKNRQLSNLHHSTIYAVFIILGKWPQFYGQLKFLKNIIFRAQPTIIEYK